MKIPKWHSVTKGSFFRTLLISSSLILVSLTSTIARSQIITSHSVIDFDRGKSVQDVEVKNTGNYDIYLNMSIVEVLGPENENPQMIELTDPASAAVLVSPKQLLVPPGHSKRIRIILRNPPDEFERIYRLKVMPYVGEVDVVEKSSAVVSAIKVLVGYNLLVIARPTEPTPDISVVRHDKGIKFTNNGNTNVLLRKIQHCDMSKNNCTELQPNRLYAGEVYAVELPEQTGKVEVWQSFGLQTSKHKY